jgi:sortase B
MGNGRDALSVRIVRKVSQILDLIIVAVVVLIALVGIYALWDSNEVYYHADSRRYEVYRPTVKEGLSFQELQKKNNEVIGWISEYGTGIDYPFVQAEDNFRYLNLSAEGTYSLSGAIFLDYRNQADLGDPVSILYGHHMARDAMFGDLDKFKEKGFLKSHRFGSLYVDGQTFGLENLAYIETDAYDSEVYRLDVSGPGLPGFAKTLQDKAVWSLPEEIEKICETDRIILLSTCATGYTDARQILAARLTGEVQANPYQEEEFHKTAWNLPAADLHLEWHQVPVLIWFLMAVCLLITVSVPVIRARQKSKRNRRSKERNKTGSVR